MHVGQKPEGRRGAAAMMEERVGNTEAPGENRTWVRTVLCAAWPGMESLGRARQATRTNWSPHRICAEHVLWTLPRKIQLRAVKTWVEGIRGWKFRCASDGSVGYNSLNICSSATMLAMLFPSKEQDKGKIMRFSDSGKSVSSRAAFPS